MAPQSPLRQSNVSKVGNFTKETKLPICLRAHVARHLVDKNSRTICKLKYLIVCFCIYYLLNIIITTFYIYH